MTQDISLKLTVEETPGGIRMQGTFHTTDRHALAELTPQGLREVAETLKRQLVRAYTDALVERIRRRARRPTTDPSPN